MKSKDLATTAELKHVAGQINSRGLAKTCRALEATRDRNKKLAAGERLRNYACPMCVAYKYWCSPCPGNFATTSNNDTSDCLCSRVADLCLDTQTETEIRDGRALVADLCGRLLHQVRAEAKRRGVEVG